MSKLRTAARLLKVTALVVRLKEQRQFPLYVKSATAIIHKKQAAAFERSFTKAIVPLFKNQVKSILAKLRALPESAVSSAKSSELLQKIYNSEEWDAELVNRALPPIAVAMSESALATFNQFIQDVERRKSWGLKCGGPGSGVPGPCPTGILRGTGTREDPIHCGENLKLAVKLLAEGHHIRLAQHEHVSTLVNKMHKTIQKAVKSGQVPPHFDLCKVTAPNSNLFCTEHKGYPRAKMPQMRGIPVPGSIAATLPVNKAGKVDVSAQFIKSLKNQGIKVKEKSIRASFLRASQAEIVGARVVELVKAAEAGTKDLRERPIFVSKDNYVLDGHHHWAAIVGLGAARGKDIKIPVYVVDVEIGESIDLANEFARSIGIAPKSGAAPAGKWYNGTGGNDDGIGREKQAGMGIDQATQGPEGKSGISDQGGLFGWDGSEFGRGGAVAGWDRQAEDELKAFCATGPGGGVDPTCSPGGGKPRQTETPEFKAWFGKSQIVNKDGSPKVMYHGTESKEDFTEFKPNSLGLIFTTEGANHASRWAGNWGNDQYGNKQRVYATYVKVENIYDGKNKDHIQAVLDYFTPEQHAASKAFWDDFWDKHPNGGVADVHKVPPNLEGLKKGGWQSVEHPQILAAIRALGHDGILTGEVDRNGVLFRGVGVFSSTQMKSATGNSGAFDPNNPDITKAFCATGAGGGVDPTCSPGQSGKSGHRIKLDMVVQTSLGSETGFDFVSHEQIANSHIGKALGWKAETLEEQIGAMTGAVPGLKMSVVLNETGRSIEVQTEPGQLYEMQRTLYVNTKGTVTAHNDLFRIHKDKGSVPPGQGVKMFRDQVNALAEAGVSEIRTNAAGSKADGADWNGYYTWPLVGYDKALTTHDLKYVPDHPQYTGMDRISDVFSTREGAAWWKENGQSLDDLVFDLSEGSYSRQRLEWYEADRAERGQPIPKAFDAKNCGTGSGGFKPGNTCARGGSQFMEYVTPEEFIAARNNSTRNAFLSHITPDDLRSHTLIMTKDGKAGAAVSPEGDIQNVFNNGGPKGIGQEVMIEAVNQGGVTLDCYAGFLPGYYSNLGFTETGRMKFNREFAPSDWDYAKDGEPDVVFMARTKEESSDGIRERFEQWVGARKPQPPRTADYYRGEDWDTAKSDSRGVAISTVVGAKSRAGDGTGGNPAGVGGVQGSGGGDGFGRGSFGGESEHPGLFRFAQAELKTFCATGPGGGVDPTCSPGQNGESEHRLVFHSVLDSRYHPTSLDKVDSSYVMKAMGRTSADLGKLIGAPDNLKVDVTVIDHGVTLHIKTSDEYGTVPFYMAREFISHGHSDPETHQTWITTAVECHNSAFYLDRDHFKIPKGTGLAVFAKQVEECAAAGVSFISTFAERRSKSNGYYTWPRFGYDAPIPTEIIAKMRAQGVHPDAKNLSDLMKTESGREWWKENGTSVSCVFDLTEGSQSRRVLSEYIAEKTRESAGTESEGRKDTGFGVGSDWEGTSGSGEMHERRFPEQETELKTFCATGPGGGVDPTCSPGQSGDVRSAIRVAVLDLVQSQHNPKERGIGIDLDTGERVYDKMGGEFGDSNSPDGISAYVDLASEYSKVSNRKMCELHTHPGKDDASFSDGDWVQFQWNHCRVMKVVGSRSVFTLEKTEKYDQMDWRLRTRAILRDRWNSIVDELTSKPGNWDVESVLHEASELLAKEMGVKYTRENRPEVEKSYYGTGIKVSTATEWLDSLDDEDIDLEDVEYSTPYGNVSMGMATEYPEWMKKIITTRLQETFAEPYWADINRTTGGDIEGLLQRGLEEGWSIADMAQEIEDRYGATDYPESRGRLIARTESGNALNGARSDTIDALIDDLGMRDKIRKVWLSILGNTTRDDHAREDGVPADDDGYWMLGGERCRWPGDVKLSAKQRCNCQCTIVTQFGMNPEDAQGLIDEHRALQSAATRQRKKSTGCGTGSGGFKPGNTCARGGGFQQVTVPKTNKAALELIVDGVMDSMRAVSRDPAWASFLKDNPPPGRDVIEKNYGRLLRSRKTFFKKPGVNEVNPELISQVEEGLRENLKNEKLQRFVAAMGPQRVVIRHQTFEDTRCGTMSYNAGVTHVYDYDSVHMDIKERNQGKTKTLADFREGRDKWHLSQVGGTVTVLRHEYGHQVLDFLGRGKQHEIQQLFNRLSDGEKGIVSDYAKANHDELFAETFALITHPEYKAADYPKWVGDFEDTVGKWADDYAKNN